MSKKRKGHKISGDPRKRAVKPVKIPEKIRTFKLCEFIDMDNPRDVDALRTDALEMKSEDICDEFLYWYQEKTSVGNEIFFGMAFTVLPFFEKLIDKGIKNSDDGTVNYDEIVSQLRYGDAANNFWKDLPNLSVLDDLTEFMKSKGYEENFEEFKDLEEYRIKMLDCEYNFYNDEPVIYSYPD